MVIVPTTITTFALNGTNKDFAITFEYLARKFIVVTLIGETRRVLVLNDEYRFTGTNQITTNAAWGAGDGFTAIEIRRVTSATERLVEFSDGSILKSYDLNTSQVQAIHIAEEARDAGYFMLAEDNNGKLDARGRRIINVGAPVDTNDAIRLGDLQVSANALWEAVNRTIRAPSGEPAIPAMPTVATRANHYLGFDSLGNPTVFLPASGSVGDFAASLMDTNKGAGWVAYDPLKVYPKGTVGRQLNRVIYMGNTTADSTGATSSRAILQAALDTGADLYLAEGEVYRCKGTLWVGSQRIFGPGTLKLIVDADYEVDTRGGFHAEDAVILNKGVGTAYPSYAVGTCSPEITCRITFDRYGVNSPSDGKPAYAVRYYGTLNGVIAPIELISQAHTGCLNINGIDLYGYNKEFDLGGRHFIYAEVDATGTGGTWIRDTSLGGRGREAASTGRVRAGSYFATTTRDEPLAIFVTPSGGYIDRVVANGFKCLGAGNGVTILDLNGSGDRIRGVVIKNFEVTVTLLRNGQRGLGTTACGGYFKRGRVTILGFRNDGTALYAGFRNAGVPATGELPACDDITIVMPNVAPTDGSPVYGFDGSVNLGGASSVEGNPAIIAAGVYRNSLGVVRAGTYRGVLSARAVRYVTGGKFYGGVRNVSEFDADIYWDPTVNSVCISNVPSDGTYFEERFARITPRIYQLTNAGGLGSVIDSNRGAVGQYVDYVLDRTGLTSPGADSVIPVCIYGRGSLKDGTFVGTRIMPVVNPREGQGVSFPTIAGGFGTIAHGLSGAPNRAGVRMHIANPTGVTTQGVEITNITDTLLYIRVFIKTTNADTSTVNPGIAWWADIK